MSVPPGKVLLLFLFSKNLDPYVNSISFAYDRLKIEQVKLIHVRGAKAGLTDNEASTVSTLIWAHVENLAASFYTDFFPKNTDDRLIKKPLQNMTNLDTYKRIHQRLQNRELIPIDSKNLKEGMRRVIKDEGGVDNCLIDLTAAAKAPSIDLFAVCLALGLQSVYVFELANPPDRENPESSLYHSLKEGDDYSYTCIMESKAVKESKAEITRKTTVYWYVLILALLALFASSLVLLLGGTDNIFISVISVVAALVSIGSPLLALFFEKSR